MSQQWGVGGGKQLSVLPLTHTHCLAILPPSLGGGGRKALTRSRPLPSSALPSSLSSVDGPEAASPDTRHLWLVSDRAGCPGGLFSINFILSLCSGGGDRCAASLPCGWVPQGLVPDAGEIVLCCHLLVHIGTAAPTAETWLSDGQ